MQSRWKTYALHIGLFLLTLLTTLVSGAELTTGRPVAAWGDLLHGGAYAFAFLCFLTFHEFGHYLTALHYRVKASLPYYLPLYLPFMMMNIGSLGAVIRLRQQPDSTDKYFDIGIAGPLAGFVVSLCLLVYGFRSLPPPEAYILNIHPEYVQAFGGVPNDADMQRFIAEKGAYDMLAPEERAQFLAQVLTEEERQFEPEVQNELGRAHFPDLPVLAIGSSLLFELLKALVPADPERLPPAFELMHYPWLFVGYITLFFTALNLLPIGQLDGGHVVYGMFGRRTAAWVSRITVVLLLLYGGAGIMDWRHLAEDYTYVVIGVYAMLAAYVWQKVLFRNSLPYVLAATLGTLALQSGLKWGWPALQPSLIWIVYAFMMVRLLGLDHPPAWREHRVGPARQALGWLAILIFVLCFSPNPIKVL